MKRPLQVTIDQGVDLRSLRRLQDLGAVSLHQVHDLEQLFPAASKQGRAFTLDRSVLDGPDLLAGDEAREVQEIIGLNNVADFHHIYSAFLNHSDFFITGDKRDFIQGGRRERLERLLSLKIRTTKEFLDEVIEQLDW